MSTDSRRTISQPIPAPGSPLNGNPRHSLVIPAPHQRERRDTEYVNKRPEQQRPDAVLLDEARRAHAYLDLLDCPVFDPNTGQPYNLCERIRHRDSILRNKIVTLEMRLGVE